MHHKGNGSKKTQSSIKKNRYLAQEEKFTTSQTIHCRLNWSIVGTGTYKITIHCNKTIFFKNLVILYGLLTYFGVYVSVCKRDDLQPILLTQFTFFKRHDVMRLVSVIVYSTIPLYLRKFLLILCSHFQQNTLQQQRWWTMG